MKPKRKTSAGVLRTLWRICANECEFGKLKSGTDKAIRSLHTKIASASGGQKSSYEQTWHYR